MPSVNPFEYISPERVGRKSSNQREAEEALAQIKKEDLPTAETETKFISEEKALEEIEKLLQQGADKGRVAAGLAGLDSDRAWEMREELLQEKAGKNSVARGINGDYITAIAWRKKAKLL